MKVTPSLVTAVRQFIVLVALALVVPLASAQLLETPPNRESVQIVFGSPGRDTAAIIGSGLPILADTAYQTFRDSAGRQVVWREIRRATDPRGGVHVFYRQHLQLDGRMAQLDGSEVGVHYDPKGRLHVIAGHQFTALSVVNALRSDAAAATRAALMNLPAFKPGVIAQDPATVSAAEWAAWQQGALLKVVPTQGGSRFAWATVTRDGVGTGYEVIVDADSGEVVTAVESARRGNCGPSTTQQVPATGYPVRSGVPNRSIKASVASDRPSPFTHEAFPYTSPWIEVYQETNTYEFECENLGPFTPSYTLLPLLTEGGIPVYKHWSLYPEWLGSEAGDAIYQTKQTMSAFLTLGRQGWNGSNGAAKIVIASTLLGSGERDLAFFVGNNDPRKPSGWILGTAPALNYYHPGASLDWIAHEWGHGVIVDEADFDYDTEVGRQLSEGLADVIGQAVEKLKQPSGTGLEQDSDWTLHEDSGTGGYARGAIDDGDGDHLWYGVNGYSHPFSDSVHKDDTAGVNSDHGHGNRLNMVFRLLAEGGQNPICSRLPTLSGCSTMVTALGVTKASQILFDVVQFYATSTSQWEDLAGFAMHAAFDLYSDCEAYPQNNALNEQLAAGNAFKAVGYTRPLAYGCQ